MRSSGAALLLFVFISICSSASSTSEAKNLQESARNDGNNVLNTIKSAWAQFGDFFTNGVHKAEDLFAQNKIQLKEKVNDTVTYLERVKQDQPRLTQVAKENLQNDTVLAYGKVDEFLKTAKSFQKEVEADVKGEKFDKLEQQWESHARQMYNGGLNRIVESTKQLENSAHSLVIAGSLTCLLLVVVLQILA